MYTMALDNDMFMVGTCISVVFGAPHNLHCMSVPLGKTCTRATIKEKRKKKKEDDCGVATSADYDVAAFI